MSSSDRSQRPETPAQRAAVLSRLQRQSNRIKRQEVETAVHKLQSSRDLSERERVVIEEMADRIITGLLEPSITALEGRTDADPEELEALSRLFEPLMDQ